MTVGNVIKDNTHPVPLLYQSPYGNGSNGTANVGHWLSRVWSGGDQITPKPPKKYITWTSPGYIRKRLVKRGIYGVSRTIISREWVYGKTYRKRIWDVPEKRKKSLFDDHPYTATIIIKSDSVYTYKYTEYGSVVETGANSMFNSFGNGYGAVADPWDANDDLKLIDKLRDKVAGSSFNMGVFLGEGRMALDMIAGNATKIYRAYNAVKRGDVLGASRILVSNTQRELMKAKGMRKDLLGDLGSKWQFEKTGKLSEFEKLRYTPAQRWLELQYGWLPLLKDVEEGAQFLARYLNFPMEVSYTARRKRKHDIAYSSPSILEKDEKNRIVSHGKLIARLTEQNNAKLAGLADPLSVAWELMPYSFVADWFIPIGTYLSARGFASSVSGSFIKTVTRKERVRIRGVKPVNQPPVTRTYNCPNWAMYQQVITTRTVSTSLDVPTPTFKKLGDVPSWKRCANAVALLITAHGASHGGETTKLISPTSGRYSG